MEHLKTKVHVFYN